MNQPASIAQPLSYERQAAEPLPGVFRDGKLLVVARGADISRYCLCCGRPATNKRITKHLFTPMNSTGSGGGHGSTGSDPLSVILMIIQLILLLVFVVMLVAEWFSSRNRTVTFGLCEAHHQKRRTMQTLAWSSILGGIALMILGIKLASHLSRSNSGLATAMCVGTFVAGGLLWVAAMIFAVRIPSLSMLKEQASMLWVKGAGEAFYKAQPAYPTSTPGAGKAKGKK